MGIRTLGRNAALGASVGCAALALGTGTAAAAGLAITPTGPQSATAGSLVVFSFVVSNDGEQSYAEPLVVTGTRCVGSPALLTKDGDRSTGTLDAGDHWTGEDGAGARNGAGVSATDGAGRTATASADATTRAAGQVVSPVTIVSPGRAALRGPAGCVNSRLVVPRVTGRRIMQVVWFVDGRAVSVRTKPDADGRWRRALRLRELGYGTHRVRAVVQFVPESVTAPLALGLRFSRCRPRTRPGGS